MAEQGITPQSEDFARWYTDIVQKAGMADYGPVRGTMIIKPYAYELWENIRAALDKRFKATGHHNAYFPLFIPMSFLEREAEHIEGFSPELAVVTHGGGKELEEPLAIRPTSETVIGHVFADWVQSYRDLPLLINQWANVVRWEKRTRPFLRTTEFLWQEGHTAHATEEEAKAETMQMLDIYHRFAHDKAAIPVLSLRKSEQEKFAGALASYSIEAMMKNKWALQSGTSHFFGQNFAKAFDIKYLDENNALQHCWTTSWGVSTRLIGAIIMTHGDDQGLRLPPNLAPIQVVIVPIYKTDKEKSAVMKHVGHIADSLLSVGIRLHVDDREELTPGYKFHDWEMHGVPLRLEIGPRDVESKQVTAARRDIPGKTGKTAIKQAQIIPRTTRLLHTIHQNMLKQAAEFRDSNIRQAGSYDAFKEVIEEGWALTWHCGSAACEAQVKEETRATSRGFLLEADQREPAEGQVCVVCGEPAQGQAYFGRAY